MYLTPLFLRLRFVFLLTTAGVNKFYLLTYLHSWRRGLNEVNPRRSRLVLGWMTVFGRACHLGM